MRAKQKGIRETQIFTPPVITNQMLDMLDQEEFAKHETYFFEPSCGDGLMLLEIVKRIYGALLKKYGDGAQALADTLFKFHAIEKDETLVPKARMRIFKWAEQTAGRPLSELEMYLIARSLQQSIECKDFFEFMKVRKQEFRGKQ